MKLQFKLFGFKVSIEKDYRYRIVVFEIKDRHQVAVCESYAVTLRGALYEGELLSSVFAKADVRSHEFAVYERVGVDLWSPMPVAVGSTDVLCRYSLKTQSQVLK